MSDRVEDRDNSFAWGKECPDRYDIRLYFSNGSEYVAPKFVKEIICTYAELKKVTLEDYIWSKPKELQDVLYNGTLNDIVDVRISDKNDYMESTLQRFVDRSVNKYFNKKTKYTPKTQTKLPESQGHIQIKNDVVSYLMDIGLEAYPEVVFYESAPSDFYSWQRHERRKRAGSDGIYGFGNVGFGNYRQEYGQQVRVDVAGWMDDSYGKFEFPIIAVEVMKSSSLREEVIGLNSLVSKRNVVYAIVVDAYGQMDGQVNGIPVVPFKDFKNGISKRIDLVKEALKEGKSYDEIFEIGRKFNSRKYL